MRTDILQQAQAIRDSMDAAAKSKIREKFPDISIISN